MSTRENQASADTAPSTRGLIRRLAGPVLLLGLIVSGGAWVFSRLMPAMLDETSLVVVAPAYVAFMLRTFAWQAAIVTLAWAMLAMLRRHRRVAAASLIIAVAWVHGDLWQLLRPMEVQTANGRATITVMSANVLYGRSDPDKIAAEARACGADVIVIQEYHPMIAAKLAATLREEWPFAVEYPQHDAFGQAVFSRLPFVTPVRRLPRGLPERSPAWADPHMQAQVEVGGQTVTITNVHLFPPVPSGVKLQRRQAHELSQAARDVWAKDGTLHIVAGDFNCVPDGHHVRAMLEAGLADSWSEVRRTRGTTWSTFGLKPYIAPIRIDHLLHGPGLVCIAAGVGGETGSDHLPTWARYAVEPKAPGAGGP